MNIDWPELSKIVATSAFTILGGVFLLVTGQVLEKLFIEPLHSLSRSIGEISYALVYYADVYMNPGDIHSEEVVTDTSSNLRRLAAELISNTNAIRAYAIFAFLHVVPTKDSIRETASNLIRLSNSISYGDARINRESRDSIKQHLKIEAWA